MARLNFGYIHSFESDVKVKIFGQVHPMSMQSFEMSFRHVWRNSTPYATETHTRRELENSQAGEPPVVAGPSSAPTRTRTDSVTGQISTDTLAQFLEDFRLSAVNRGLRPPQRLTGAQQQQLAQDAVLRAEYIRNLRSQYASIARSLPSQPQNRENSDVEDDEENNEENDEESDEENDESSSDEN
jgi:hypothetical protein